MSFKWNWLLSNLNQRKVSNRYQVMTTDDFNSIVLYTFRIHNGVQLDEIHTIYRAKGTHKVISFYQGKMEYHSFRTVIETVDYIVDFVNRVNDAVWKIDFENLPEQKKYNILSTIIINDSQYLSSEVIRLWYSETEENYDRIYRLIMQDKFIKESKKAKYKNRRK